VAAFFSSFDQAGTESSFVFRLPGGIIASEILTGALPVPPIRPYPFTAIVGQERMKRALILNAISNAIGGVLIRGERGTAKSTAARALAALLPEIEVVADCPFACDPSGLDSLCDNCRDRLAAGEKPHREQDQNCTQRSHVVTLH